MKIRSLFAFAAILCSCGTSDPSSDQESAAQGTEIQESAAKDAQSQAAPDGHNSKIALDWDGTYTGILPCADCEGIRTSLTLKGDETYTLTAVYLGKDNEVPHRQSGSFTWSEDGGSIAIDTEDSGLRYYKVGEEVLIQLDMEGQPITGDLAAMYRLEKVNLDAPFEGKKMEVYELMGNKVEEGMKGQPFIQFDAAEKRVSGYAGCNNFFGGYTLSEGQKLSFGQMGATKMACEDMTTEDRLFNALSKVDSYAVGEDGTVSLNRARMAPLVRLREAAPSE